MMMFFKKKKKQFLDGFLLSLWNSDFLLGEFWQKLVVLETICTLPEQVWLLVTLGQFLASWIKFLWWKVTSALYWLFDDLTNNNCFFQKALSETFVLLSIFLVVSPSTKIRCESPFGFNVGWSSLGNVIRTYSHSSSSSPI